MFKNMYLFLEYFWLLLTNVIKKEEESSITIVYILY